MRYLETMQLAITAAETGHLVLATLHTSSAPKTIDRIIDVFPPESKPMIRSMLSASLEAVIAQSLVKLKSGDGRALAHEILLATMAVRNLIREGQIHQIYSLMQVGSKYGMITMRDCVFKLLEAGEISEEEARRILARSTDGNDDEEAADAERYQAQPRKVHHGGF